ncbi:MAG: ABC transporter permease [Clostridia bacterium]
MVKPVIVNLGKIDISIFKKQKKEDGLVSALLGSLLALFLAFCVAAFIISLSGANPLLAMETMIKGAFSSKRMIAETLIKATPLLLAAEGLTICYRAGMISIGSEGQIIMGGLFATVTGLYFVKGLPSILAITIVILAAALGGGLWALIPAILKAKLGVSEVINTIMLNYIALYGISYLLDKPLREPSAINPQSSLLPENLWLPNILPGTRLHFGFILALLAALFVYLLLWRSPWGYQMRAVGFSQSAAKNAGIPIVRNLILSMVLSGVFAGIAGGIEITGIHHRLMNAFSAEVGFDAMAVALLGKLHPVGVVIAAIFFGALRVGSGVMQRSVQVPSSLVSVIQGLVIIFVLMDTFIKNYAVSVLKKGKEVITKGGHV